MNNWIYHRNDDNTCRYTLGIGGKRMLICCGINPSTAKPNELDNTVRRVDRFVKDNGYDGYIMINIYPQISTDPKNIHHDMDENYHSKNLEILRVIFETYPNADMWAAWGTLIGTRSYFYDALNEIYEISSDYDVNWVHFNKLTKDGHPRHPLYLRADSDIFEFDIDNYIRTHCECRTERC